MEKRVAGLIAVVIVMFSGYFVYGKMADDTYEGMAIIPEENEDIPLYKGLVPNRNTYTIKGDHREDIYKYYLKELPVNGWILDDAALDDNDWRGFRSTWIKNKFDGELHLSVSYNEHGNETEVIFDKTPRHTSTEWVKEVPGMVCIYENPDDRNCRKINNPESIKRIVHLLNSSLDWNEAIGLREKMSLLMIGDLKVEVHYESDKEVYFRSHKGIKIMKPELEF
ncbi:hypothetical protein [Pseudalkalibacillus salsuginis]|uniref:hypothetical protein n=1 Tax=Pseudalkalibacillus salsuginis TaxID=2910972 RepID=UPI001F3D2790|nr:hypothetical protein [Pseudalkalibacillus salsuginis]MCF6409388.1 hypothetical protein [Pseudalkalibacillus salsuginis]